MNMTVWNPFREMESLLDRYSQARGRALTGDDAGGTSVLADWSPTVDVEETDDRYLIKADLPGVERDQIEVSYDQGVLSIQGERKEERQTGGKGSRRHRTERFTGRFARFFTLPAAIEVDAIEATFENGVLSLNIPKAEEVRPRAIEIKVD